MRTLPNKGARLEFRDRLIAKSIEGQNILDQIRTMSPDLYEKIVSLKSAKATELEMQKYISSDTPNGRLNAALNAYVNDLRAEINVLPRQAEMILGWEAVSEWLYSCPLDFPESDNG